MLLTEILSTWQEILLADYNLSIQQSVQLTLKLRDRNLFLTKFLKRNYPHLWTLSSDLFQTEIIWQTPFFSFFLSRTGKLKGMWNHPRTTNCLPITIHCDCSVSILEKQNQNKTNNNNKNNPDCILIEQIMLLKKKSYKSNCGGLTMAEHQVPLYHSHPQQDRWEENEIENKPRVSR